MRNKFSYRKQVQRFPYEKAALLRKGDFYYENKKFNYEKEVLFWKKTSVVRRKVYCEKRGSIIKQKFYYVSRFLLGQTILYKKFSAGFFVRRKFYHEEAFQGKELSREGHSTIAKEILRWEGSLNMENKALLWEGNSSMGVPLREETLLWKKSWKMTISITT